MSKKALPSLVWTLFAAALGAAGCTPWDSGGASTACTDETTSISPSEVFRSAKTGETVDVPGKLAKVDGTWAGLLRWAQPNRDTTVTLTVQRVPGDRVKVYYCGEFQGLDAPTHLALATGDGAIDQGFTGNLGFDSDGRVMGAIRLDMAPERVTGSDLYPPGIKPTSTGGYSLSIAVGVASSGAIPFSDVTIDLAQSVGGANPEYTALASGSFSSRQ
jgi:hypothetical protein